MSGNGAGTHVLTHAFFGTAGVRWSAYTRPTGNTYEPTRTVIKVTTVAAQGQRYEPFSESVHTMEVPLRDLQRLALVLTGRLGAHEVRIPRRGGPPKVLYLRHQGAPKPFYLSLSVGRSHGTPFGTDDAWHMLVVVRRMLSLLYPHEDPSALFDLFLRSAMTGLDAGAGTVGGAAAR